MIVNSMARSKDDLSFMVDYEGAQKKIEQKSEAGLRFDAGKSRWDLVPPEIGELVDVYTFGATKYAARNWELGMSWGRVFGSLLRHAWAFWRGEDIDRETGMHHMAHCAWNAIALLTYSRRGIGLDDRVKLGPKTEDTPAVQ